MNNTKIIKRIKILSCFSCILIVLFSVISLFSLSKFFMPTLVGAANGDVLWATSPAASPIAAEFFGLYSDNSGNTYALGYITGNGTYDFGNGVTVSAGSSGSDNAVMVKYNSSGQAQWAASTVSASNGSYFYNATTDSSGNLYAVGFAIGSSSFDFGNGATVTPGSSSNNALIVKYNSSGQAQWAASTTSSSDQSYFYGAKTDSLGNVYVDGYMVGNSSFNFGSGVSVTGGNLGSNILVLKYSPNGTPQWAKSTVAGAATNFFGSLYLDSDANIYIAGVLGGNTLTNFGDGVFVMGPGTAFNPLLIKYNTNGTPQWAKTSVTAPDWLYFTDIVGDGTNLYMSGVVRGTASPYDFGNGVVMTAPNNGVINGLITKYDLSGNPVWAKSLLTAPARTDYTKIAVDGNGNSYVGGALYGTSQFDFGNGVTLSGRSGGTGNGDVLIVKYDSLGDAQWAHSVVTGPNYSYFNAVSVDSSGNPYGAGTLGAAGSYTFGNGVSTTSMGTDAVIIKYEGTLPAQSPAATSTSSSTPTPAPASTTAPQFPPTITSISTTTNSATIHFTSGDGSVTQYEVDYGTSSTKFTFSAIMGNSQSRSFTIGHLNPATKYFFRLIPLNVDIPGPTSNIQSATTMSNITRLPTPTSVAKITPRPTPTLTPKASPKFILLATPSATPTSLITQPTLSFIERLTFEILPSGSTWLDRILVDKFGFSEESVRTFAKNINVISSIVSAVTGVSIVIGASVATISISALISRTLFSIYAETGRSILNFPIDLVRNLLSWIWNSLSLPLLSFIDLFYLRKIKQGVVFETFETSPLSAAWLVCFSESGNLKTTFSDDKGNYSLKLRPDKYKIRVEKSGYKFPSTKDITQFLLKYGHVYKTDESINIDSNKNVIEDISFAMDPINPNQTRRFKLNIGTVILAIGFVFSGAGVLIAPSLLSYIILIAASTLLSGRLLVESAGI